MYMAKYDISDGFYRMFLDLGDALKLSILMPCYEGELQLIAVPLSTMKGWVLCPPTFCTASKTVADLANASLFKHTVPSHFLEDAASLHDSWEPSQPNNISEEPSSPDAGGPSTTLSPLAGDQTPALKEEPSSSNDHGPLTMLSLLADDSASG